MKLLFTTILAIVAMSVIAQNGTPTGVTTSKDVPVYVANARPQFSTTLQYMMDTAQYQGIDVKVNTTSIEYYRAGQYKDSIGIVTVGQAVGLMVVPGRVGKLFLLLNGLNIMRTNSDNVFVLRFQKRRGEIICTTQFISRRKLLRLSKKMDVQVINYI